MRSRAMPELESASGASPPDYEDSMETATTRKAARARIRSNDLVERPGTAPIPRRRARNSLRGRRGLVDRWAAPTRC